MRDLFLKNKISGLDAFNASVAAQASGARNVADVAGAGHYGKWKGNLARDVRRAFLKEVDKPNVYWARIPCKDLATGAAKTLTWCPFLLVHEMLASLVEKHAGDVSSFTATPQQLWSMKRNFCANHGINDDLTLGVGLHGDGVAHQKRTTVECSSWNVLVPQRRTLLVRFGGEGRVVSFGTVAVPTLSSTRATLTPFEASVGNAECL